MQSNGVIFPKELLVELAINLEHVGHGRKYALTYSCRFAGATIKLTPMLVRLHAMDRTWPTLARVERVHRGTS